MKKGVKGPQQNIPQIDANNELTDPKILLQSLEKGDKSKDLKPTVSLIIEAYGKLLKAHNKLQSDYATMEENQKEQAASSSTFMDDVDSQMIKFDEDIAKLKDVMDDKITAIKVSTDIRYSKYFLKVFMKNDKRMKSINSMNVATESMKILNELKLDIGNSRLIKAETKFERRNLFGSQGFKKYVLMSFGDFVTAERLLRQHIACLKSKPAQSKEEEQFYLELPSTAEMRKIMATCRELKNEEDIASVTYSTDSIRVMMKKSNPADDSEIPKKYDVKNLHQIDNMRKKFGMKNSQISSKQIFNEDYWNKKREGPSNNRKPYQASHMGAVPKRKLNTSADAMLLNDIENKEKKQRSNSNDSPKYNSEQQSGTSAEMASMD